MNRLAREKSPYLLQHAANPVDWYPWGDDAFDRARRDDKPVFLSIGYSTCHWCHVMAHESFEDARVAEALNRDFVPIKVDREERPDIDRVYMTFVQATKGSGGWPLSVWLTPDRQPFYGGTYFPPESRGGRAGFLEVLAEIARAWRDDREGLRKSAAGLTERLREVAHIGGAGAVPGPDALEAAVRDFASVFDRGRGGFGSGPKFPRPSELLFLFREYARTGNETARDMALHTLRAMAFGGMRDHVGGGFHRYAVDADWRVPHFEKMLYDQAQLVLAYLEAAQITGGRAYADVADDTLRYVARDLSDQAGGFHSAEDADSLPAALAGQAGARKSEGAFYLWTDQEIGALLGEDAALVRQRFGVEPEGNAPFDPQGEFGDGNQFYVARSAADLAEAGGRDAAEVMAHLDHARQVLFEARSRRPRPHLDDKVLTAWNGLMIAAFARGGRLLGAAQHLERARRAARFLRQRMWDDGSRTLLRRYRDGDAAIDAYADDYAALIFGLVELFQADGDPAWIEWAAALQQRQDELFWDEGGGGWFSTTGSDGSVLLRFKEDYDGAEPSASSLGVANLLALSHLTGDARWRARIDRTLQAFAGRIETAGRAVPMMLAALSAYHHGLQQVVIVGRRDDAAARDLAAAVDRIYLPFAIVVPVEPGESQRRLARLAPFIGAMTPRDGRATAYVCRDFTCRQPTADAGELAAQLSGTSPPGD